MKNPKTNTNALLKRLFQTSDLKNFIQDNSDDLNLPSFQEYLRMLCDARKIIPEQVIKNSGIERTYGHQLFNGTRKPSRDKVLQLAIGLKLDLETTQSFLQIAQKSPLYPRIKRDAAVIYCIRNQQDIFETQNTLQALNLTALGHSSGD